MGNPVNPYRQTKTAAKAAPTVRTATKTVAASRQDEATHDPNGNFNPPAFTGTRDTVRDVRAALSDVNAPKMFDKAGQLNAYDRRDAMHQIAHLMQQVLPNTNVRTASDNGMSMDEKRKVLAAAMTDPTGEGFAIVGQELLLPVKDILDYEGWARKLLRKRKLGAGELFRIPKDVRATAWVIGQDGQSIEARVYGKYIQPGEFKITAFPTVDIEDLYQINYDILERAQDTARQSIELEEDKRCLALIDMAAKTINTETAIPGKLNPYYFEEMRYQIERHRLVCEKFLINRAEVSDLIGVGTGYHSGYGHVDPVTERELLLAGYVGNILNCQIITAAGTGVEEVVPAGTIYAVTGPEYLGEMGTRIELFSEPFNKFSHRETVRGWAFIEMVGFGLPNPRSVSKGSKS